MNGLITRTLAMACLAGGLAAGGCIPYRNMVDVCYPQRYNVTARREVVDSFAPQVQNGHVLDQTIWNYHFDKGSDKLNAMGLSKLQYLTRRRPQPDPNVFLATATDVTYDAEHPETMAESRRDLDSKRVASIQRYLQSQMAGRSMAFEIMVHDPFEVGESASKASSSIRRVVAPSLSGPAGTMTSGAGGAGVGSVGGGNQTGQFSQGAPGGGQGGQYSGSGSGSGSGSSDGSSSGGSSTPR